MALASKPGMVVLALLLWASPGPALSGVWIGAGATPNWSEAANWHNGIVPGPGELLYFPPGAGQTLMVNDIAGASFHGLVFGGTAGFTLIGQPLTLTGATAVAVHEIGGSFLLDIDLRFTSRLPIIALVPDEGTSEPPPTTLAFCCASRLTFTGGTLIVGSGGGQIVLGSRIVEEAPTGVYHVSGDLLVSNSTAFSGPVWSEGDHLVVSDGSSLGSTAVPAVVKGVLALANPSQSATMWVGKSFIVTGENADPGSGTVVSVGGAGVHVFGAVHIAGAGVAFQPNVFLALRGPVSSSGHPLVIDFADGIVELASTANSFADSVQVRRGILRTQTGNLIPDANAVVVGAGASWQQWNADTIRQFTCRGRWSVAPVPRVLVVTEGADIEDCQLETVSSAVVQPGSEIVLIERGGGSLTGTFRGLPEGSQVLIGGYQPATLTYHGGPGGNDVALSVLPLGPATTLLSATTLAPTQLRNTGLGSLIVAAVDDYGRPAAGRVRFEAFDGCGTFAGSPVAVVDITGTGFAPSPQFTTGDVSRVCTIVATAEGTTVSVTWTLHLYDPLDVTLAPVPAEVSSVAGSPFTVGVDVLGAGGMQLPGLWVIFEVVPAGGAGVLEGFPGIGSASPVRAQAQFTANGVAGDYEIVARAGPVSRAIPVHQRLP